MPWVSCDSVAGSGAVLVIGVGIKFTSLLAALLASKSGSMGLAIRCGVTLCLGVESGHVYCGSVSSSSWLSIKARSVDVVLHAVAFLDS